MNGPFLKPMKTTKSYSPKVSIEFEKIETLIKTCNQAINHSVQTEVFLKHNPHVHVRELRQALATVVFKDEPLAKYFIVLESEGTDAECTV